MSLTLNELKENVNQLFGQSDCHVFVSHKNLCFIEDEDCLTNLIEPKLENNTLVFKRVVPFEFYDVEVDIDPEIARDVFNLNDNKIIIDSVMLGPNVEIRVDLNQIDFSNYDDLEEFEYEGELNDLTAQLTVDTSDLHIFLSFDDSTELDTLLNQHSHLFKDQLSKLVANISESTVDIYYY